MNATIARGVSYSDIANDLECCSRSGCANDDDDSRSTKHKTTALAPTALRYSVALALQSPVPKPFKRVSMG
jgi:hypothetical protein